MINWRDRDQLLSFIGMDGLEVESMLAESGTSKFDLTLMLTDSGEEIFLEVEYSTDLFDADRIERMIGHFQTLLESAAADTGQRLAALPLLTPAEQHALFTQWNPRTARFAEDGKCIHQLFEAQAARTPNATALVFGEAKLTYTELDRRANELAERLRTLGVGPDVLVALFLERSLDMVVALLAILKAGGAYVPLDPALPTRRLAYMMADAQPLAVVTERGLSPKLPPHRAKLVLTDDDAPQAPQPERNFAKSSPGDLAYVIYTSGSTGLPKGVEVEHRAVVNFLTAMRSCPGMTARDTMLAITTLSFDIAVLEIFLPLITGARLVVAPRDIINDGKALAGLLERSGATIFQATPASLRMLLDSDWRGGKKLKILCGGESWTAELAAALLSRSASLWNMYGPTETTVWSAVAKMETGRSVPIGLPIANTRIHILDKDLQPVPVGIPGELHIGGDGLARGYHNRPELTQEKFISDPFRPEAEARLYKTGDLARYLPDGGIEYLGRIDHQVKIRGFRIELGEIESALTSVRDVREAVVTAREDIAGEKQLIAYLVGDNLPDAARLRRLLRETLPDYMVPAAFVVLDRFPLTPSGKVDRKKLPAPESIPPFGKDGFLPPASTTEIALARIWQEIIGVQQVGLRDNFFELGGHSIMGVRLIERINRTFHCSLAIADIFRFPTLELLSRAIDENLAKDCLKGHRLPAGLVETNRGDAGLPIFCLPGLGATAYAFHILSARIGTRRPMLAMELHRLGVSPDVFQSMKAIAQVVVQRIRQVQPRGPYTVLGYSFGGLLAVEVAQQILASGEKVESLLVLDVYGPGVASRPKGLRRIANHLKILARSNLSAAFSYVSTRVLKRFYFPKSVDERHMMEVKKLCAEAHRKYSPKIFPGHMTLVTATHQDEHANLFNPDGTFGWGTICEGGVEVIPIACRHLDFFNEPHISDLASHLTRLLNDPAQSYGKNVFSLPRSDRAARAVGEVA
jgi:amino acid adenylation domain-containing protein